MVTKIEQIQTTYYHSPLQSKYEDICRRQKLSQGHIPRVDTLVHTSMEEKQLNIDKSYLRENAKELYCKHPKSLFM